MKKLITHSKSSLFLIEMILSILILALTCTVCVRIFAAAKTQREEARELNHIQELVTSAGETLEVYPPASPRLDVIRMTAFLSDRLF